MLLLLFVNLVSASTDIKAKLGEEAILPCQAPNGDPVLAVEWTRGDLKPEYVFLYRDGRSDPENQQHSFVNRVELVDDEMKNGNLSVRLNNVMTGDSGTYECHVVQRRTNRRKRSSFDTQPIRIIELNVEGPTPEGGKDMLGYYGNILSVAGLIVVLAAAAAGFVIFKKSKGRLNMGPVDEADVHQQLQENEKSQSKTISVNISDIQV